MSLQEEIFDEVLENETLMGYEDENALLSFTEETEQRVEEEVATSFRNQELENPTTFKDWIVKKVKGTTITNVVMISTGILLLYEFIKKQTDSSISSGTLISLSSAIKGAQQTLESNYDETIVKAAQTQQQDPDFSTWSEDIQNTINSEATMNGEVYWLTVGPGIMEAMAEMPIYDASS